MFVRVFLLIYVTALVACTAGSSSDERTPVEVWRAGDDGLTVKVAEAIEQEININHRLRLSRGGQPGSLIILVPKNVAWKAMNQKTEVEYTVEYETLDKRRLGSSSGSCFDDALTLCANDIVATAIVLAGKRH